MTSFERLGRARKVSRMLAEVPYGRTANEVAAIAAKLAAWPQRDRNELATAAGCNPPSETTWAALVVAARSREPAYDLCDAWEPKEVA